MRHYNCFLLLLIFPAISCHSNKVTTTTTTTTVTTTYRMDAKPIGGEPKNQFLPKARIYRTNGDYIDNVPIQMNADRTAIVSYPAPSDLSDSSKPLQLADGYLLDRRGIGLNSAFTSYTYDEYMHLPSPPSLEELKLHIIPQARVTEVVELPITLTEAQTDTSLCNRYILELPDPQK